MSVTAVPLQPIKAGSARRLWLAIILVVVAAAVLAWAGTRQFGRTADGLRYQILEAGNGGHPTKDDFALVSYKGMLPDGTVFDENPGTPMELASTVPGFADAVTLIGRGGHVRAWLPANLAYGDSPPPGSAIPANSPLLFDIHLQEFKTRAEIMAAQRQMQMQQMLQKQMGQQGADGSGK